MLPFFFFISPFRLTLGAISPLVGQPDLVRQAGVMSKMPIKAIKKTKGFGICETIRVIIFNAMCDMQKYGFLERSTENAVFQTNI